MPTQRTVLITGASGGLGTTVTAEFRKAGYRVVAVARNSEVSADLTTTDGIRKAVEAAGPVDILLHLMGAFESGSSESAWSKMIELNLRPAPRLIEAVVPGMKAKGWGRIVAIGSKAGETGPAGIAAYAASKAAVHALIQSTAAELTSSGVTANAILPTTIDTPANRKAMPKADTSRWATPAEIAAMLLFLVSDQAAHINGALIPMGE